jgi:hypothetical protein
MRSASTLKTFSTLSLLALLAACNGGGGGGYVGGGTGGIGGGGTTGGGGGYTPPPSKNWYSSPNVTVNQFVSALNSIAGYGQNQSTVMLYTNETYRSMIPGQEEWFVIYDDKFNEYKAVSLQYIRAIVYWDYYSNNTALASEFRAIETDDILSGNVNGDFWGDDYEVVDWNSFTQSYWGRRSGFEYEDEAETKDVSLMTAELQQREFIKKAASISYAFNVSIETSLSLASLGDKAERMLKKSGELTLADQLALAGDFQRLTGVSLPEMMAATQDQRAQGELVEKIATKIGTSAANLENRILPELFGIEI